MSHCHSDGKRRQGWEVLGEGVTVTTLRSEIKAGKDIERQENPRTSLTVLMSCPLQFLDGLFHGRGAGLGGRAWRPMDTHWLDLNPCWTGGCVHSNILISPPPGTQ